MQNENDNLRSPPWLAAEGGLRSAPPFEQPLLLAGPYRPYQAPRRCRQQIAHHHNNNKRGLLLFLLLYVVSRKAGEPLFVVVVVVVKWAICYLRRQITAGPVQRLAITHHISYATIEHRTPNHHHLIFDI
jgi:hypothetical protein